MSNTSVRVIVGAIGIPIILVMLFLGNEVFLIFCAIVSFFCMNEFYNLFEHRDSKPSFPGRLIGGFSFHKAVFLTISTFIVVCFYYQKFNFVFILYFVMFMYLIFDEVVVKVDKHLEAIGTWMLSLVYISTPFGLMSLMDSSKFVNQYGINYVMICFIMVWVSDTFAFFGGKTFGKHKLAERISPKKTWEGSIFGFAFTLITGIVVWKFFNSNIGLVNIIIIAIIVGVFSQLGDLFESHLKRSVSVKDSSLIIPGHGGFLDRFDSVLFAVPALYIILYLKSTVF
jgi:phosphatidate cytidylyltransferase